MKKKAINLINLENIQSHRLPRTKNKKYTIIYEMDK